MVIGVPIVTPINFNKFAGKPPVHVVLYSLAPSANGEKRHLSSRKTYYFRAAVWSSSWRPQLRRIEALTGTSEPGEDPTSEVKKKNQELAAALHRLHAAHGGVH